jgi:hypothetical protein
MIVALLNRHFVPVYARNDDYRGPTGAAPPAERVERERIYREALAAKLSTGTVHAYVLDPAGHPIDSLHVAEATKPERMTVMLERAVTRLKVAPGEPLFKPCCQSQAPTAEPGGLVLHLTARYLARKGEAETRLEPTLGTERSGQWAALPSEDWIVLTPAECARLLPPGPVRAGAQWDLDREVAARLLTHFYPPTENTDLRTNRIDEQALGAKVVSVQGTVRARIEGRLWMKHPFYHKDTEEYVETGVVGYLEIEPGRPRVRALRLATEHATYGAKAGSRHSFGVAVRSIP